LRLALFFRSLFFRLYFLALIFSCRERYLFRWFGFNATEFTYANLGSKGNRFDNLISPRGKFMSVRNGLVLLLAISTFSFLVGCGGNGTLAPPAVAPPSGNFSNSNLSGTYVFSVSGTDAGQVTGVGNAFAMVGAFTASGNGGNGQGTITGGTIDLNDLGFAFVSPAIAPVSNASITGGSYSVGIDGRGKATLNTSTPFGTITLDFVLQNSFHGLVTEFDGNASGSGTIDQQTTGITQSSLTGAYAFSLGGADSSGFPFATVGAFTLAGGSATITGGAQDFNDANIVQSNETIAGQVTLGPASSPATQLVSVDGTLTFDVYAIDATHLKFIEMDSAPILSGDAYSQPTTSIAAGPLAFTMAGSFPFSTTADNPVAAGGFLVADGGGNITTSSTEDINNGGAPSSLTGSSGTYTASAFPGRLSLSLTNFFPGSLFAAYPSSGGLLLLEIDPSGAGIMLGAAYPQSSLAFPAQGYGLNLTGDNLSNGVEVDDIAEFAANATGTTVTGLIDENFDPGGAPLTPAQVLVGTYTAPDTNGRGSIGTTTANNTLNGGFLLTFYAVDGTTFPFVETDNGGQVATGVFVQQNPTAATPGIVHSQMFVAPRLVHPHGARQRKK
jgi:hypothetical protein